MTNAAFSAPDLHKSVTITITRVCVNPTNVPHRVRDDDTGWIHGSNILNNPTDGEGAEHLPGISIPRGKVGYFYKICSVGHVLRAIKFWDHTRAIFGTS